MYSQSLKDLFNDIWYANQSGKLVCNEENKIPPRYTKGEAQLKLAKQNIGE